MLKWVGRYWFTHDGKFHKTCKYNIFNFNFKFTSRISRIIRFDITRGILYHFLLRRYTNQITLKAVWFNEL
jgi:hypothetical protein